MAGVRSVFEIDRHVHRGGRVDGDDGEAGVGRSVVVSRCASVSRVFLFRASFLFFAHRNGSGTLRCGTRGRTGSLILVGRFLNRCGLSW